MSVTQAAAAIYYVAKKADCKNMPRISISFDSLEDKFRFERELKREFDSVSLYPIDTGYSSELTVNGINVRII